MVQNGKTFLEDTLECTFNFIMFNFLFLTRNDARDELEILYHLSETHAHIK